MKIKNLFYLVIILSIAAVGISSCDNEDDIILDITFDQETVTLSESQTITISVKSGNGGYEIIQKADESKAVAVMSGNGKGVDIRAVANGSTSVVVKDARDKTATLTINVTSLDIWKDYTGIDLVLDGSVNSDEVSVKIEQDGSDERAKLTLNNIVAGEPVVVINNATITKSGKIIIVGKDENPNRDISFDGTIENGKLAISVNAKIKTQIVGDWNLRIKPDVNQVDSAALIIDVDFGPGAEFMAAILKAQLAANGINGQLLGSKVEYVRANFKENGQLDIQFKATAEGSTDISTAELVDLRYFVYNNNQVYLAIDKAYLDIIGSLLGDQFDISVLTSLMGKVGNHYVLPLHTVFSGNEVDIKVDKFFIAQVLAVVDTMGVIPEEFAFLAGWLQDLAKLDYVTINAGLGFEK